MSNPIACGSEQQACETPEKTSNEETIPSGFCTLDKNTSRVQVKGIIEALTTAFTGYPEEGFDSPFSPETAVQATVFWEGPEKERKKPSPQSFQLMYYVMKRLFTGEVLSMRNNDNPFNIEGNVYFLAEGNDVQAAAVVYENFPNVMQYLKTVWVVIKGGYLGEFGVQYLKSIMRLIEINDQVMEETAQYMRRFYNDDRPAVYLAEIGVDNKNRGENLGRKLLQKIIDLYNDQGKEIFLNTSDERNKRLYERMGFIVFGDEDVVIDDTGQKLHFYYMRHPASKEKAVA